MLRDKKISGLIEFNLPVFEDDRGCFIKAYDEILSDQINKQNIVQANISVTRKKGTVRGMHFQYKPFLEYKIIRCLKGKVLDVLIDLREGSSTYGLVECIELCSKKNNGVIVPPGVAHGFQSLVDNVEMLYLHTCKYSPQYESGVNVLDESLKDIWPLEVNNLSDRDKELKKLKDVKKVIL